MENLPNIPYTNKFHAIGNLSGTDVLNAVWITLFVIIIACTLHSIAKDDGVNI